MSFGSQINYKQLLERHEFIRIPMIQRDFAQGRTSQEEVREEFLKSIKEALCKPATDPSLPLNLDFIYGSVEGDGQTRFLPLDGQQRLTTLFLLHWYLAWKDNQWSAFNEMFLSQGHSRFNYSVRPSSNEFFDNLVIFQPSPSLEDVTKLSDVIIDQPWYFLNWRLDPTIQSVLNMLDSIHNKFIDSSGLFTRLLDKDNPPITFQLLDLENFGLSDDLYIKMNARGKPLTAFETFKSRYEQELANQLQGVTFSIEKQNFVAADYIARRMDTTWASLFWKHRKSGTDLYDEAFMNVFRVIALVARDPESKDYQRDISKLRNANNPPSYGDFHSNTWLDEQFTYTLVYLLDSWCGDNGKLLQLLPDNRYLDEGVFFEKIVSNGANLFYTDLVQFVAYAKFIGKNKGIINQNALQEWMRIIRNLAMNTTYNRVDDFRRSVRGIVGLLEFSGDILRHFTQKDKAATGFSDLQISEEMLKAKLILSHDGWRVLVDRAEGHGYFRGQIGFILDFSGIPSKISEYDLEKWDASVHDSYQKVFIHYLNLAEAMFSEDGLIDSVEHRWQRALLSLGDYMLQNGRNRSFLVNPATEDASWKRLLSGSGSQSAAARTVLNKLFNIFTPVSDLSEQLDEIIKKADNLDPWREAIVNCPSVFDYCERSSIRVDEYSTIYLLKRSQMNGAHAELFTYCLYEKLHSLVESDGLTPLVLKDYYFVNETGIEPGIRFGMTGYKTGCFELEGSKNGFLLYLNLAPDEAQPPFVEFLVKRAGFTISDRRLSRKCSHSEITTVINDLRHCLKEFSASEADHG